MRLQQFIAGEIGLTDYVDQEVKQVIDMKNILDKECKPYINELSGAKSFLWRGMQARTTNYMEKITQRKDRTPRYISKTLHNMLDEWSLKNWKFKSRSSAAFTSASRYHTTGYGHSYLFFPIGAFKYAWNDDVSGLYKRYDHFDYDVEVKAERYLGKKISEQKMAELYFKEEFVPLLKRYKTRNLNKYLRTDWEAKRTDNECIVFCNEYYIINEQYKPYLERWYM